MCGGAYPRPVTIRPGRAAGTGSGPRQHQRDGPAPARALLPRASRRATAARPLGHRAAAASARRAGGRELFAAQCAGAFQVVDDGVDGGGGESGAAGDGGAGGDAFGDGGPDRGLRGARCLPTVLRGAVLRGAVLPGAVLPGAVLRGAVLLVQAAHHRNTVSTWKTATASSHDPASCTPKPNKVKRKPTTRCWAARDATQGTR